MKHVLPRRAAFVPLFALALTCAHAAEDAPKEAPPPREAYIEFCFNYGCEDTALVRFEADTLARAGELFAPVETPAEERTAIARAIVLFYGIAGEQTPISADLAGNKQDEDVNGRMDCIDHTRTISRLLALFEKRGWLRHHTIVEEPVHRRFFIFDHIAPALDERPANEPAAAENPAAPAPEKPEKPEKPADAAAVPPTKTTAQAADKTTGPHSPQVVIRRFNLQAGQSRAHTHETRTGLREVRLYTAPAQPEKADDNAPEAASPQAAGVSEEASTPAAEPPQGGRSPLGGQRMTDARSAAGVSVGASTPAAKPAEPPRYVVDGWLVDFGKEPIVLPYEEWRNGGGPDVGY